MFTLNNVAYSPAARMQKNILEDVTLAVPEGRMTVVVGLNGAGKTTLLKLMSGVLRPLRGIVRVGKYTLSGDGRTMLGSEKLARLVAYVPQDFPTDFPFTVAEFVMMGRFAWRKGLFDAPADIRIVHSTLKRLNLRNLSARLIHTLSGGERQRVLLARALVQDAPAILLDEPANHLDIKNKRELYELLRLEHQNQGKTVVAVTHDLNDVKRYFHHVVFLKEGRCVAQGPVSDLFTPERLSDVFDVPPEGFAGLVG